MGDPAAIAATPAWSHRIERAVALDRTSREPVDRGRPKAVMFKHPAEAFRDCVIEPQRISNDSVNVQAIQGRSRDVDDLEDVTAVVGSSKPVQQGAFDSCECYASIADPSLLGTESRLGCTWTKRYVVSPTT